MLMKFKLMSLSKSIWIGIVSIVGIVIVAGATYYQLVYKASPEYSLKIIYTAIQNGDTETFYKYVEGETILHKIYDPYIEKLLSESDARTISMTNSKGETRILNLGESLLFTALDNYEREISDILLKKDLKEWKLMSSPKDPFIKNMVSLTEKDRYQLVRVEKSEIVDSVIHIVVVAVDTTTETEKSLAIEMTQTEDRTWHITNYDFKSFGIIEDGFSRI